jgi:GT2 family glycosyltransferase
MTRDFRDTKPRSASLPTCSVVVCTRDRPETLDICLRAITTGTRSATDVIVIDSAPSRASAEEAAARWGAKYFREPRPGLSRARNRAARESRCDVLAFVDDDALPEDGWLEALLDEFVDPAVAVVGGRVWPLKSDEDLFPLYRWFGILDLGEERRVVNQSTPEWFATANFRSFVIGANMAVRRSVYERWKGFDERMGAGAPIPRHEESKAFFELVCLGYSVAYVPDSMVRHPYPREPQLLIPRALDTIESSSAYAVLLLCEKPEYWKETLGYLWSRIRRINPFSYRRDSVHGDELISRYRILIARLKGVLLYVAVSVSVLVRRSSWGGRPREA